MGGNFGDKSHKTAIYMNEMSFTMQASHVPGENVIVYR